MELYPGLRSDCSGFLKKVAQELCVVMSTGDAKAIVALPLTDAWIGEAVWDSARGIQKSPHKNSTPAPLDEVLYFALPLATLKAATYR